MPAPSSRRAAATVIALVLSATSCSPTAEEFALAEDHALAVCLTGDPDDPRADLCSFVVETAKAVPIRRSIDRGIPAALGPTRTRAAFFADGGLRIIDLDGENERLIGPTGSEPEWLSFDRVAFVAADGRSIRSVATSGSGESQEVFVLTPEFELDGVTEIDSFDWHAETGQLFVALASSMPDSGDFTEGALLLVNPDGTTRMIVEPTDGVVMDPDVHPDGDRLVVSIGLVVYRVDIESRDRFLFGYTEGFSLHPTWSRDGTEAIWAVNGLGADDGPVALIRTGTGFDVVSLSDGEVFDLMPWFPTWS